MEEIEIVFNGFKQTLPAPFTIADLIEITEERDGGLIVEHNNRYVFKQDYGDTFLAQGDKVEFINPDFGG
jgi:thiamine biosynthesis protein ThiS